MRFICCKALCLFAGPLPEAWGQNGSFSQMTEM